MRTRSTQTGALTSFPRFRRTRPCGGTWSPYSTYRSNLEGSTVVKTIRDVEIANFNALRRSRPKLLLPFNPCEIETIRTEISSGPGENRVATYAGSCSSPTSETYGSGWTPVFELDPTASGRFSSNADSVIQNAVADARDAIWDVSTELAEFPETVRWFISIVERIGSLRKNVLRRAAEILRQRPARRVRRSDGSVHRIAMTQSAALASAWLEYRYAVMPVIYSMEDFNEAMVTRVRGIVKGRAFDNVNLMDNLEYTVRGTEPNGVYTRSVSETVNGTLRIKGYAVCTFNAGEGRFGFDPIKTAWELIPLSFVVDWVFNVGNFLSSVSPFAQGRLCNTGFSFHWEFVHSRTETITYLNEKGPSGGKTVGGWSATILKECSIYQRYPQAPDIFPNLSFKMGWERYTDLAALVRVILFR